MIKTKKILEKDLPLKEKTVCTVGNFDGFHIGHQQILKILKQETKKRNLKSAVVTFYPHPKKVLSQNEDICTITNIETRLAFLSKFDIDFMVILKFDRDFQRKTPLEFLQFLKQKLNCELLIVGEDWRFGYKKKGDIKLAIEYGKKLGITVIPVKIQKKNSQKISSTIIRKLLKEGKVDKLKEFLGRKYCIFGKVVKGSGKGKSIGYPTLNIKLPSDMCLKRGVYAGYVIINQNRYYAAINFGSRPTVDGKNEFLEVHIIQDVNEDLQNVEYVKVIFEKFIRSEKKFQDINSLKKQISKDIKIIKEVLSSEESI